MEGLVIVALPTITVSPEATARNVMIRAEKRARRDERAEENALKRYRALARQWQLAPALERLLGERWRG